MYLSQSISSHQVVKLSSIIAATTDTYEPRSVKKMDEWTDERTYMMDGWADEQTGGCSLKYAFCEH